MLAKIFILSVLTITVFTHVDQEPWETSLEVSGFGSSIAFNMTGVDDKSDNEHVVPSDDCDGISSRVCQNFNELRQNAINSQINKELEASYTYMAMASYFSRDDPHLMGFAKFFYKASAEEREHALKLVEYQNSRGGEAKFMSIQAPSKHKWSTGLEAMEEALTLEKEVNLSLLKLHQLASNDPHMQDFLDNSYLTEQVESIRELSGFISRLKRLTRNDEGLGEHMFDHELKEDEK